MKHDARRLLERVLAGDLAPDADEVLARAARDPELAEALEESQRVVDALECAGRYEREVLGAAREPADAEVERIGDLERIGRAAEAQVRGALGGGLGRRARWTWAGVAAAALLAALLVLGGERADPGRRPSGGTESDPLGAEIELVQPTGSADVLTPFRWSGRVPAGGWFEVVVYDGDGVEVARSGELDSARWEPDRTEREAWPREIRWEVTGYDAGGAVFSTSESARAWRSAP